MDTGKKSTGFGWDSTTLYKEISVKLTNNGTQTLTISKYNFRFTKGSNELLVQTTLPNKREDTILQPNEVKNFSFSPERLEQDSPEIKNYNRFRCEVITSIGKRVVSKFTEYNFDKLLDQ